MKLMPKAETFLVLPVIVTPDMWTSAIGYQGQCYGGKLPTGFNRSCWCPNALAIQAAITEMLEAPPTSVSARDEGVEIQFANHGIMMRTQGDRGWCEPLRVYRDVIRNFDVEGVRALKRPVAYKLALAVSGPG